MDHRHPAALAEKIAGIIPKARLADVEMNPKIKTSEDLARQVAPAIREFITELNI